MQGLTSSTRRLSSSLVVWHLQPQEVADKGREVSVGEEQGGEGCDPALDRTAAIEDCARLQREAELCWTLVETLRQALAVLQATALQGHGEGAGPVLSVESAAMVGVETSSAIAEAEALIDALLTLVQVTSHLKVLDMLTA